MPTGYTAKLSEGEQSFQDFVGQCIEAFMGEGLRTSEQVEKYFNERLQSTKNRLDQIKAEVDAFEAKSMDQIVAYQFEQHSKEAQSHKEYVAKKKEIRVRYEAMRDQILRWQPPGPEYMNFKDWMLKQINDSIDHDCSTKYDDEFAPKLMDPKQYRDTKLATMKSYLKYYEDDYQKAVANRDARLKWIRELEANLKQYK